MKAVLRGSRRVLPAAGTVLSFRTAPFTRFSPAETGRWAALRVIGASPPIIAVLVLDGIWTARPSLAETAACGILRERRFSLRREPAIFGLQPPDWKLADLREPMLLGETPLSAQDRAHAEAIACYGIGARYGTSLASASEAAEGEWRWAHDRDALRDEVAREQIAEKAEAAAARARFAARMAGQTWDRLRAETPLAGWSAAETGLPPAFVAGARRALLLACAELSALAPKPRKPAARAIFKRCVAWFNHADHRIGGMIGTAERDDIRAALAEMARLAGQKRLLEEIDGWRDW
jgi:hypothetical protein